MYTFIAYKPDSSDYAYGCCLENYGSNFVYENDLSRDTMINLFKRCLEKKLKHNEEGYDIIVLFNGVEIIQRKYYKFVGRDSHYEITREDGFKELAESILAEINT
jgi:hypothetical protein